MSEHKRESAALAAGGLSAVLASACCLGPLVLVSLGLGGGAWVSNPYRDVGSPEYELLGLPDYRQEGAHQGHGQRRLPVRPQEVTHG